MKRSLSSLALLLGLLMIGCAAPPTERSVQVFDKDGHPVPHAIVLQDYSMKLGYPPNIAVTDKNGYYSFKLDRPNEHDHMFYSAYDKDGRFYSLTVMETGLNLNTQKIYSHDVLCPSPPNQFDKNANPNFKIYCTKSLLDQKDENLKYISADRILIDINPPRKKILNGEETIKKYIKILEKIKE